MDTTRCWPGNCGLRVEVRADDNEVITREAVRCERLKSLPEFPNLILRGKTML